MAWDKKSEKDFSVWVETLTLASGSTTATNSTSFDMNSGRDFTVMANRDATNLTSTVSVNVLMSHDNTNFGVIKTGLISDIDGALKAAVYDSSTEGEAPYFKIQLAPLEDELGETIVISVARPNLGRKG